jgi:hypothetical protein
MTDDFREWNISLTFGVPPGDVEGVMAEAFLEAAAEHVPEDASDLVVRADTVAGKVWVTFSIVSSRELADGVAQDMRERVRETVVSGDETCVSAK